jgi:hypothetical protein
MRGKDGHGNVTFCHADFYADFLTLFLKRGDCREEEDEALAECGMGDNEVTNGGVGKVAGHGELDDGKVFAYSRAKGGETEDAVVGGYESFEEAASL